MFCQKNVPGYFQERSRNVLLSKSVRAADMFRKTGIGMQYASIYAKMSKRRLSSACVIPPAHRQCYRLSGVDSCPATSPACSPTSPYTGPIGSPPRHRLPTPFYDDCPSYSPTSPAYDLLLKYHPTFDRTDVMSPTSYDVDSDPLRFAPIKPSKITTWTWPLFPKPKRPRLPLPKFNDDVECDEVARLCQRGRM